MRLLISALTGVIVACLIFSVIFFAPRYFSPKVLLGVSVGGEQLLEMVGPQGVAYQEPRPGPSPCILNVTLYEFTAPLGPGSEADLTVEVTSKRNFTDTFRVDARMISPFVLGSQDSWKDVQGEIQFSDGGSQWTWSGNLEANETKTFTHTIKATGLGYSCLKMTVETRPPPESGVDSLYTFGRVELDFVVMPDNVLVYSFIPSPRPRVSLYDITGAIWIHGGVGTEFNVSIDLFGINATDVTLRLITPEGIAPIEGQTTWIANATVPGERVRFETRLKLAKVGTWFVYAYVEKDNILLDHPKVYEFIVSDSNSTVLPII
jgi:hypothetical protein